MEPRFEQFLRERQYLANVTPATIEWYRNSLRWLLTESPSHDDLKDAVMRMRQKGLKPTGCNSVIQALNSYAHWVNVGSDTKCGSGCRHPKVAHLKTPDLVLPTFTEQQVRLLIAWKPKGKYQLRLHVLTLFLLDTGCRISEALTLRVREIDFDNLLVTLDGKGRKQRVVPFSFRVAKSLVSLLQGSQSHIGQPLTGRELLIALAWIDLVTGAQCKVCQNVNCGAEYTRGGTKFCSRQCERANAMRTYRVRLKERADEEG